MKSERKGMSFNVLAEGLHHEDHYHLRHGTSHEVPRGDEEEGGSHREDLSILIRKAVREERKRDKFRERKRCVRERDCARPRDEGLRGRTSPPIPRPHSPELTHPLPSSTYPLTPNQPRRLSCQVVFVLLVVCAVALAGFLLTMPEYFAWVAESYRGNARAAVDQGDPRARGQWREVF